MPIQRVHFFARVSIPLRWAKKIAKTSDLDQKPEHREKWAVAAARRRDGSVAGFDYPALDAYAAMSSTCAETSMTHNWFGIPRRKWEAERRTYEIIVRTGFVRFAHISKKEEECAISHSVRPNEIDFTPL